MTTQQGSAAAALPSTENEPLVHQGHPELHHYTGWHGLSGIWTSNTIWATRYDCLNDRSEVEHFRDYLTDALADCLAEHLKQHNLKNRAMKRKVLKAGGRNIVARREAKGQVDRVYDFILQGGSAGVPFAKPFVASFCSHTQDDAYERDHGLLSQWRAYGGEVRFAVVFDTKALSDMMKTETERFQYLPSAFSNVIYGDANLDFRKEFRPLTESFFEAWLANFRNELTDDQSTRLLSHLLRSMARFKHPGFREEREFCIIANPVSPELSNYVIRTFGRTPGDEKPLKQVHSRPVSGREVPYIRLFEESGRKLPIKRIIVGPSSRQKENAKMVRGLVGRDVEVMLSRTPYIEWSVKDLAQRFGPGDRRRAI